MGFLKERADSTVLKMKHENMEKEQRKKRA